MNTKKDIQFYHCLKNLIYKECSGIKYSLFVWITHGDFIQPNQSRVIGQTNKTKTEYLRPRPRLNEQDHSTSRILKVFKEDQHQDQISMIKINIKIVLVLILLLICSSLFFGICNQLTATSMC